MLAFDGLDVWRLSRSPSSALIPFLGGRIPLRRPEKSGYSYSDLYLEDLVAFDWWFGCVELGCGLEGSLPPPARLASRARLARREPREPREPRESEELEDCEAVATFHQARGQSNQDVSRMIRLGGEGRPRNLST